MKTFLRWAILGCSLIFIGQAIARHWQSVSALRLTAAGGGWLLLAGLVTLAAHFWAGWVWHWLLRLWQQPGSGRWTMRVYLYTNLTKYLPGNVWHFVGRVRAVQEIGGSLGGAVVSVVAEPLLMAAAAVGVGAITSGMAYAFSFFGGSFVEGSFFEGSDEPVAGVLIYGNNVLSGAVVPAASASVSSGTSTEPLTFLESIGQWSNGPFWTLGLFVLWALALTLLHPRLLNPRLRQMGRMKLGKLKPTEKSGEKNGELVEGNSNESAPRTAEFQSQHQSAVATETAADGEAPLQLRRYPLQSLLGEMGFVLIRSLGFILAVMALAPLGVTDLPGLVADFSLAWVAGLVVPGAPGGIGVFEACAIALLGGQLPPAIILGSVACYRLVSVLAEVAGAAIVWLYERFSVPQKSL
ncbi:MAG: UPF0104 family protein [Cyanobacteria bacterium J06634_5]